VKSFTILFCVVLIGVSVFSCATGGETATGRETAAGEETVPDKEPAAGRETTAGKPAFENETPATPDGAVTVDKAFGDFTMYIAERLPEASLTAVVVMDAPVQRLGNYLTDELISRLLNDAAVGW
jgi:hypothetical protein